MEREKRNCWKRKYIRLLMVVVSSYNFIFATPSLINIEYFPKVVHISEVFTVKFYMDSRLNSSPKIILNDGGVLLLETSNIFIENGNTVIENQYKINKTGFMKLDQILLHIEDKIIEVPPIELEVQANPLSKDTEFRIRIFKYTEDNDTTEKNLNEHDLKLPFTIGKQYFILIEGVFEKKAEQKISIKYDLPENAFIEKLKSYPMEFKPDEMWKPIDMFLWIPLKKGTQTLPEFNLILDISKTQEYKLTLEKMKIEVLSSEKSKPKKDNAKEDFQNRLTKELEEEHIFEQYTKKEVEVAKLIKKLREEEHSSFFYADLQREREKLEKELGLENTFTVFHYRLYIMSIIIAIIFLTFPICQKIVKKRSFNFYDVLSFCISIFILIYGIKTNDFRKEFTVTKITESNIYISPEISSTVIENISIGETLKIIHTSKDWYFVETTKNIRGWLQKKERDNEI